MPPGRISDPGGLGLRARSPPVRGAAAPTRLAPGVGGPDDDAHTMVTLAHPPRRRLRPVRWRRPARATARFLLLPLSLAARPTTGTARSSPLHPATVTASARFVAVRVVPDRTLEAAAQVMRRRLRDLPSSGTVAVADGSLRVSVQGPDLRSDASTLRVLGATGQLWLRPVLCGAPSYVPPPGGALPAKGHLPACPPAYRYGATFVSGNGGSQYAPGLAEYPPLAQDPSTSQADDLAHPGQPVLLGSGAGGIAPRYLLGPAVATSAIVRRARAERDATMQWLVVMTFTASGSRQFNRIAASHFRELLANDVDGFVVSAPLILARNFGGTAQITGAFTKASARALASELTSGPLPVSLRMVATASTTQRT